MQEFIEEKKVNIVHFRYHWTENLTFFLHSRENASWFAKTGPSNNQNALQMN